MAWWSRKSKQPAPPPAEPPLALFRRAVAEHVQSYEGVLRLELEDHDTILVWVEGSPEPRRVFVGSLFHETREHDPERKRQEIERFVRLLLEHDDNDTESWASVEPRLIAVARADMLHVASKVELLSLPLVPCVSHWVVVDSDESMRYVSRKDLQNWGVDAATVLARSLENLAALEHHIEHYAGPDDGIWHVINGGDYESSRLLAPGVVQAFAEAVGGDLAFAMPARSSLLFARLDDDAALAQLQDIAVREYKAASRPLSADLYVWAPPAGLAPLQLPSDHRAYAALKRARIQFVGGEYQEQKQQLEERFQEEERDLFVASFSLLEREGSLPCSFCVWGERVECLLPETDLVMIAGGPEDQRWSLEVTWSTLLEAAGAALVPTHEFGPQRWHAVRWLSEDELQTLRSKAAPSRG